MKKIGHNLPTIKKRKLIREKQEEENKIKRRLTEANQEWCDWKFQIHWNKLGWMDPRIRDERKNQFFVSSKKKISKIKINLHIGLVTRN